VTVAIGRGAGQAGEFRRHAITASIRFLFTAFAGDFVLPLDPAAGFYIPTAATLTVHVPMTFAFRGGRKLIISDVAPPPPQQRTENALLKAIARAFRWRALIENGTYGTITEMAAAKKINDSDVARVLRLTLLPPEIVEAILNGQQPTGLQLDHLLRGFSVEWREQQAHISR
jgi:hypothetical protein